MVNKVLKVLLSVSAISLVCLSSVLCGRKSVSLGKLSPISHICNIDKVVSTGSGVSVSPVSDTAIVYTKAVNKDVKDYYSGYTYGVIEQEISSGVDLNHLDVKSCYRITVDTKSKMTELVYKEGNKVKFRTLHDYNTNSTYVRREGKWVEKVGKYKILDWDLKNFDSVYDVYKYLNCGIPIGTEGTSNGSVFTFCSETNKVNKKAISGVGYDSLDKQTSLFVLKLKNKRFIPVSSIVDIEYSMNNIKYYCRTCVKFSDLSSKKHLSEVG